MNWHFFIVSVGLMLTALKAEKLLVDSREIFPNSFAFIIQTEKDSAALKNPSYAINTDLYTGLKKGLWINVAGFGSSIKELEQYKSKYPQGYIKKLGQYRNTSSIERDSVPQSKADWVVEAHGSLVSDTQLVKNNSLLHIIRTSTLQGHYQGSDTFSISTDSEVKKIETRLFHSRACPLVVERNYYSVLTGSTCEIRTFHPAGKRYCAMESFTNDGGPEDPINSLGFDSKTDQPVLQKILRDSVLSQKPLSCNSRN